MPPYRRGDAHRQKIAAPPFRFTPTVYLGWDRLG
jgi:hypothetical protein